MKLVCISDLHEFLPVIQRCDLLLIAGDITFSQHGDLDRQWAFLDGPFRRWLQGVPARQVVGIAGNHDQVFEKEPARVRALDLPWIYLEDSRADVLGLGIWGTPWTLPFQDWAFNADADELECRFGLIPCGTDIILTHGPPRGVGDNVIESGTVRNIGAVAAMAAIHRVNPKLYVCGHVHEGRSMNQIDEQGINTVVVNCCLMDPNYKPVHAPIEIDL